MTALLILVFILGYLAITLEHPLKLDKTVPALLMAAILWAFGVVREYLNELLTIHNRIF